MVRRGQSVLSINFSPNMIDSGHYYVSKCASR